MLFLKAKQLLISKESSQYSKFFLTLLFSSTFSGQYWSSYLKTQFEGVNQIFGAVNMETLEGKPTHVDIDWNGKKEYVMVGRVGS